MRITLEDGTVYKLHFMHHQEHSTRMTELRMHQGPCNDPCADSHPVKCFAGNIGAYAVVHPDDMYNKSTGRKVALARAIKNFSREYRAQIWEAYWAALGKVCNILKKD